jgi:hypothetical protein
MSKRRKTPRSIRMDQKLREALDAQLERFRQKFGRDPGPDDPVFFDPDAAEPRALDDATVAAQMVAAMTQAGVAPAIIHAYRRTGRIVTLDNVTQLSDDDLAEWQAAIEEYRSLEERRN